MPARRLAHSTACALGLLALLGNLGHLRHYLDERLSFVSAHRAFTLDEKLRWNWGELQPLATLIRQATPPQSTILIPAPLGRPGDVWHDVANVSIVRSFVYPRTVTVVHDADWPSWSGTTEANVFALVLSREMGGQTHVWPPREAIAGWRLVPLPSAWGIAASPATGR
jgi:hypothetical protein